MSINKTNLDYMDNREAISNKKVKVPSDLTKAGSVAGKTRIAINDSHNTVVFCSKKKDPQTVEYIYRRHLNLDTAGLKPPKHMVNGIEPDIMDEDE